MRKICKTLCSQHIVFGREEGYHDVQGLAPHQWPGDPLLPPPGVRGGAQKVIRGNIVEPAQGNQVTQGHFVGAPFIPGVHGLGGTKEGGYLGLGQIVVLPQSSETVQKGVHGFKLLCGYDTTSVPK